MTTYKLGKLNYELLKTLDVSELGNDFKMDDTDLTFSTNNIRLLMIILNEIIVEKGMENQDVVTEYGKRLYGLYDEIYIASKLER